jgi:glycosyltransferase involved in cell wall biosynthesis
MKILMFGWEFPPYMSGGLGTACLGMTRALTEDQIEILFVMPGTQPPGDEEFIRFLRPHFFREEEPLPETDGIFFKKISVDSPLSPYLNERTYRMQDRWPGSILAGGGKKEGHLFTSYAADLFSEIDRYGQMAKWIAGRGDFDVIHSHDWMTSRAAYAAREISGKRWIFHVHSLEYDRSGEAVNREIWQREQAGLQQADHIIAVSGYTKQRIVKYYGIAPDKITVVYNGVTQEPSQAAAPLPAKTSGKNVLFLGRITFQKGPDYFIEAAAEVLKHIPDASFFMAGSGDMMPAMIERVAELGIGRHVHFTGFLQGEEIEEIFRISDVYVLPSVSEPFGISPLEAIQHGVPVILSRQSGVSEIFRHCFLVDFWDIHDMADKIIALLRRKPLVEEMRANAKAETAKITWRAAAEKIRAVYQRTIHSEGV